MKTELDQITADDLACACGGRGPAGRTVAGLDGVWVNIPKGWRGVQGLDGRVVPIKPGQGWVQGLDRKVVPLNRGQGYWSDLNGHIHLK